MQNNNRRESNWLIAGVCAAIIAVLAVIAQPGVLESAAAGAKDSYYNLLVQGFRAGHLYVNREPAPGLAHLADPYNPALNAPLVWDRGHLSYEMSYYKGKLYLYFGVTPALVLFWPYAVLTGHYLPEKAGIIIFIGCGLVVAALLMRTIRRRYFPESGDWAAAIGLIAIGLASGIPPLLSSFDVYEVAKSCGFMFSMLALAAIWCALHRPEQRGRWLAAASLAYGLAVGSRPSLLFGAVILLAPLAKEWQERNQRSLGRTGGLLAAAVCPISCIGVGLLLYNDLRFGNPFEFGWHYQLTSCQNNAAVQFSPHYFWFNFLFYFWRPIQWNCHFPFLHARSVMSLPAGYLGVVAPYAGIFANAPVAWMALFAPLAWWRRRTADVSRLRWFECAVFLEFAACALTLCLFFAAGSEYELDFLPALMFLAALGIFAVEEVSAGSAVRRNICRCGVGILLAWSVAFNLLAAVEARAAADYMKGNFLVSRRQLTEAAGFFERACDLQPDSGGYHFALANALSQLGRTQGAIAQYHKALEINASFAEADNNLAFTLLRAGNIREAIDYYQRAIKIHPTYQAYYNLGWAFRQEHDAADAIACFQKAVDLQPRFIPAQIALAWILATWPESTARNGSLALALAKNADRLAPNNPAILRTLAAAYGETGKYAEAAAAANEALAIAKAQSRETLARQLQAEADLYQSNSPCRSFGNPD